MNDDFINVVDQYLVDYLKYLKEKNVSVKIIDQVESFYKGILMCLNEYYSGQHYTAYEYFKDALKYIDIEKLYRRIPDKVLYRARVKEQGETYCFNNMFHIAFENRYKVKKQRFSYPGLPCLYLGSSADVCYLELSNENCVLLKLEVNNREQYILDLAFFINQEVEDFVQQESFYLYWPLVACCSFIYKGGDDMTFRPDYIISQFLLEYIMDQNVEKKLMGINKEICGIRYYSVKRINICETEENRDKWVNYVFPVSTIKKEGLCDNLIRMFKNEELMNNC